MSNWGFGLELQTATFDALSPASVGSIPKIGKVESSKQAEGGRTQSDGRVVRSLESFSSFRTRLDKLAPEAFREFLSLPRIDFALVDAIDLVPDEHYRHSIRILDPRDLLNELVNAEKRRSRCCRVNDEESVSFTAKAQREKERQ